MNENALDRREAETRFAAVFENLGFLVAYARRRGARDPDAIAAEAMAVAWRRLADVPSDDPRPWLIVTTRNLMLADRRKDRTAVGVGLDAVEHAVEEAPISPAFELDPDLAAALRTLSEPDREALLLVAWEDLTPAQAAASLGMTAVAFRVRLHRARRRLADRLTDRGPLSGDFSSPRPQSSPQPQWRQS